MPTPHIEDDILDQYAMGNLPKEFVPEVEEHLLICSQCQERLSESDEFIALFRTAAVQADARPAAWKSILTPRMVFWTGTAAATAAMALAFLVFNPQHAAGRQPAVLVMHSLRGPETGEHIASGRPGVLIFDLDAERPQADYEVEIVDATGTKVLRSAAELRDGKLSLLVHELARGSYWVRLYRKQTAPELVAEYGLRAE
jgi:hypothetical protein